MADWNPIAAQRLVNQQLVQPKLSSAEEIVAWMGAVQAQDFPGAKWGLGLRLPRSVDADIEQAFTEGRILRTHVMRPTWHFVAPQDIRWLLELTAPRVKAVSAYMLRQLELDETLLGRCNEIIGKALVGGKQLTRAELGQALARAGIAAQGQRLGYILMVAELERVVCSGARRGKQFTYALLEERAPAARSLPREQALAELTHRFFTSHGPALVKDFAWWSGLTQTEIKAGLAGFNAEIIAEQFDGKTYWRAASEASAADLAGPLPPALLLPAYDEFTIAYKDHDALLDPIYRLQTDEPVFNSVLVLDGRVMGFWRRTFSKGAAVIETAPFRPLTEVEKAHIGAAAQRYAGFLGLPVIVA